MSRAIVWRTPSYLDIEFPPPQGPEDNEFLWFPGRGMWMREDLDEGDDWSIRKGADDILYMLLGNALGSTPGKCHPAIEDADMGGHDCMLSVRIDLEVTYLSRAEVLRAARSALDLLRTGRVPGVAVGPREAWARMEGK